ncbi:hypothetical protein GJ496_005375 [Pomphorhynchus laevis]|nr:hypothetical protein GJ496_003701 [Pomphorhynchus laevis]KAI0986674.1 hypothetical protein GJ496_005375 [Pomphorhynchus laevis]
MGTKSRKPRGVKRIDVYVQFEIGCDCDGCNQRPYYCGFCCAISYDHKPATSNQSCEANSIINEQRVCETSSYGYNSLSTDVTIGSDDLIICPSSTKRQPRRIWTNGLPHQYYRNRLNMQSSSSKTESIITGSRSPMSVLTNQVCGSELQQSISTESLSGNIGCSSFDPCNNHKVNDSEGELERCGPWRRLSNSISSDCAHVESESYKRIRHKDFDSVSQTRFDNDIDAVKTIISTMFDYSDRDVVSKLTVRNMFRLGKKTSGTHPRLLQVVLGSTIEAKSLLNRGLRLKNQPVRILKDLSHEERIFIT